MSWLDGLIAWRDRSAYRLLCRLDRLRGSALYRLATSRCRTFLISGSVHEHSVYITEIGTLRKWASFRCPGECGRIVRLRLAPTESPHWEVNTDWLGRATITPSVRQLTECDCHFWVRRGCVHWCPTPDGFARSDVVSGSAPGLLPSAERPS